MVVYGTCMELLNRTLSRHTMSVAIGLYDEMTDVILKQLVTDAF